MEGIFKKGEIVKSKIRTEAAMLFVMVLDDKNPSDSQFNGVVIKDKTYRGGDDYESETGFVTNIWNKDMFQSSSWDEVKPWL